MGTVFKQPARLRCRVKGSYLEGCMIDAISLSNDLDCKLSDVIKMMEVLEIERYNNLYVNNGDAFDEQIGGIAGLLVRLINVLEEKSGESTSAL